jgi:hypothetical protein
VPHFDLLRGCGKVGHRDQYVVEFQSHEFSRPRCAVDRVRGVPSAPLLAEDRLGRKALRPSDRTIALGSFILVNGP